jgi:hypothetical protein
MQHFVRSSFTQNKQDRPTGTRPFASSGTVPQPSEFEMLFLLRSGPVSLRFQPPAALSANGSTGEQPPKSTRYSTALKRGEIWQSRRGYHRQRGARNQGARENILVLSLAAQLNHAPKPCKHGSQKKLAILSESTATSTGSSR